MSLANNGQLSKKEGKTKATCATSRAAAAALILKCTEVQRRKREKGKEVLVCLRLSEVEDKTKQQQLLKQNT